MINNAKMDKTISDLRKEKKLTQKELADQLGVTDKAVSKWERGLSYPDISLLPKISEVLGVSINELVSGESAAEHAYGEQDIPTRPPTASLTPRKLIAAGSGTLILSCIVLFLAISAIGMGLAWVFLPVTIIAGLWLIPIIGTFVLNKNKITAGLFCGAVIFAATYYYASLNQATTRDIARYGEFNGFERVYLPHYTIIITMFLISLAIALLTAGIFKKPLSGNTMFFFGVSSISMGIIAILTVSSIMDYVDIHGLSVNPQFTILLLITCLINCLTLAILLKRQLSNKIA